MLNIVLPIAGYAQRFKDAGYNMPKPLIMADGRHIIDWAMDSIDLSDLNEDEYKLIFIVRLDHIYDFSIDEILRQKFGSNIEIVTVDQVTQGALCTCLLAEPFINDQNPLLIYTPDVYFKNAFNPVSISDDLDGLILTFNANSPAHSYVQLDENGYATRTAEKRVISKEAAVGVYYYKTGAEFVQYANKAIEEQSCKINGEFYICPMYNDIIEDGKKVKTHRVEQMHVLGTPAELEFFIHNVSPVFGDKPLAVCADHSGFYRKQEFLAVLREEGIEYVDMGTYTDKSCDYYDYVEPAINAINSGLCDHAVGFCRTGQGINILANKFKGIRSALVFDDYTAEYAVRHNCANFFAVPSKYMATEELRRAVRIWKNSSFDGGRHMTRMKKTIDESIRS